MILTTKIEWRKAGAPYVATCNGIMAGDSCGTLASWCRQWQSAQMSGPAFDYYCDAHALEASTSDGIELATENPYSVGSVWYTSWGYDQTNVEFYQVVRETKASVWLREIAATYANGRVYPNPADGDAVSDGEMHRKPRGEYGATHPYLHLDSVRTAWPYDGGGKYDTRAAGQPGH